jgi:uncharacterized BrkB/YihY/UPF0761 family membrane protein
VPELPREIQDLTKSFAHRLEQLEDSRSLGVPVATTRRFFEIEGLDLGGLLALELFTTVIPLILIGFGWASDFSDQLSFGDLLIKQLELKGPAAEQMHDLFGTGASLKSTWTVFGLASFLFWGIPMSAQVAKTFGRAFRRRRFSFWGEVWRGTVWFALFMFTQALTLKLSIGNPATFVEVVRNIVGLVPSFLLWSVTPVILVRDEFHSFNRKTWPYLMWCGLAGVALDAVGVRLLIRFLIPALLGGWVPFGPIGVAMALMTLCTFAAALWVLSACLSAVLWERRTPTSVVLGDKLGRAHV